MQTYKLSIVIPTKNREFYCIEAIKEIVKLNLKDIEIIIQDNGDDSHLEDKLKELKYTNILYHYHKGILSFVDNFSEAISLAHGQYICMIGDDDGILPNIVEIVDFAIDNSIDAIIPGLNSVYCWPSNNSFIKNGENGYLCLSYIKPGIEKVNCLQGLKYLVNNAGQDYQNMNVPRVYHGIVKKIILDAVKERTGNYFKGLTPDIYMTVALSLMCKKVYKLNYPVTISGICPKSGSSDSATGKHTGKLNDAPHFKGHDHYEWDEKAPKIYSVESIWAETVLQALNDFKAKDFYECFRVDVLDSICLRNYPQFSKEIVDHAQNYGISKIKLMILGNYLAFKKFVLKALRRISRTKGDVKMYYDVVDISNACDITVKELRKYENK